MAIGRAYRIKKSAVKAYGYTKPPSKKGGSGRGPRYAANGSVTHIAAINGRGSYRSARRSMAGLSANKRKARAGSALSHAKKTAFAKRMRALKKNGVGARRTSSISAKKFRVKKRLPGYTANARKKSAPWSRKEFEKHGPFRDVSYVGGRRRVGKPYSLAELRRRRRAAGTTRKKKSRRTKAASTATRKAIMARKTRRKKSAARKPVARRAKRRVKRRKSAKRSAVAPKRRKRKKARKTTARAAAPKRRKRRKARKTTLKANPRRRRRRLRRNSGTSAGARKGWRTRKARRPGTKKRRMANKKRRSRKGKRRLSMKKSAVAARRRRRAARGGVAPKRRRSRRRLSANRKRRSRRTRRSSSRSRRLNPNRRRRSSRRRLSSNRKRRSSSRRLRRNGRRRMFRKNGVMEPVLFVLKTGGLALTGFLAHKLVSNALATYGLSKIFGTPAVAVATPSGTAVAPPTAGLGGLSLDPAYQKLIAGGIVAALGVFAASKLIKDSTTRNTVATGIAVSFTTTLLSALATKFMPQYAGLLSGAEDGTAARLSAMYGMGGTSIMPRYSAIGGRGMGEYFQSGVSGLGEYFQSGVSGLGEYFQSGLGALPSYEANAGYGANPDLMEAAAGMGARETMSTNHVDPHGDLDRELTIAEAAAGVGAYEAAAGFGAISTVPSSSTWIPGTSNGQLWAGTRSISSGQSATEMVPAGILQTDGGQGVFG